MCKYCSEKYDDIPNSRGCEVNVCKNEENYTIDVQVEGYEESIWFEIDIEFCPKCGRKL